MNGIYYLLDVIGTYGSKATTRLIFLFSAASRVLCRMDEGARTSEKILFRLNWRLKFNSELVNQEMAVVTVRTIQNCRASVCCVGTRNKLIDSDRCTYSRILYMV